MKMCGFHVKSSGEYQPFELAPEESQAFRTCTTVLPLPIGFRLHIEHGIVEAARMGLATWPTVEIETFKVHQWH